MKNLIVENLEYNGRKVHNQFVIWYEENGKTVKIYQSYKSIILKWENGVLIEIGNNCDYSRTTGKYRNYVTVTTKKEFEKMLQNEFTYNKETQTYIRNN